MRTQACSWRQLCWLANAQPTLAVHDMAIAIVLTCHPWVTVTNLRKDPQNERYCPNRPVLLGNSNASHVVSSHMRIDVSGHLQGHLVHPATPHLPVSEDVLPPALHSMHSCYGQWQIGKPLRQLLKLQQDSGCPPATHAGIADSRLHPWRPGSWHWQLSAPETQKYNPV